MTVPDAITFNSSARSQKPTGFQQPSLALIISSASHQTSSIDPDTGDDDGDQNPQPPPEICLQWRSAGNSQLNSGLLPPSRDGPSPSWRLRHQRFLHRPRAPFTGQCRDLLTARQAGRTPPPDSTATFLRHGAIWSPGLLHPSAGFAIRCECLARELTLLLRRL
jgi:hypothetical protein